MTETELVMSLGSRSTWPPEDDMLMVVSAIRGTYVLALILFQQMFHFSLLDLHHKFIQSKTNFRYFGASVMLPVQE